MNYITEVKLKKEYISALNELASSYYLLNEVYEKNYDKHDEINEIVANMQVPMNMSIDDELYCFEEWIVLIKTSEANKSTEKYKRIKVDPLFDWKEQLIMTADQLILASKKLRKIPYTKQMEIERIVYQKYNPFNSFKSIEEFCKYSEKWAQNVISLAK